MKEKKGLVGIPFDSIILLFMPYILYIHVMCFSKLREHKFDEEKKNLSYKKKKKKWRGQKHKTENTKDFFIYKNFTSTYETYCL